MPLSGYVRLQSAALQLAASFEHAFPFKTHSLFVWRFAVDCGWYDEIGDGVFGTPMNRWGAFLWAEKRFPIFELMIEEIIELRGIIAAIDNCRSALRAAVRGSPRVPREVLIYADLFRKIRRSRWADDGWFDMGLPPGKLFDPDDDDNGDERTASVVVRRPNVALVRQMARVVGAESPPASVLPRTAVSDEVFVPAQADILRAIDGRALRTSANVEATEAEQPQMFHQMKQQGDVTATKDTHAPDAPALTPGHTPDYVFALGKPVLLRTAEMVDLISAMMKQYPAGLALKQVQKIHTKGNARLAEMRRSDAHFGAAVALPGGPKQGGYRIRSVAQAQSLLEATPSRPPETSSDSGQ